MERPVAEVHKPPPICFNRGFTAGSVAKDDLDLKTAGDCDGISPYSEKGSSYYENFLKATLLMWFCQLIIDADLGLVHIEYNCRYSVGGKGSMQHNRPRFIYLYQTNGWPLLYVVV